MLLINDLNLEQIGHTLDVQGNTGGNNDLVAGCDNVHLLGTVDGVDKQTVGVGLIQCQNGKHAPGEGKLMEGLFFRGCGNDGLRGAELGNTASGESRLGDGDDDLCKQY